MIIKPQLLITACFITISAFAAQKPTKLTIKNLCNPNHCIRFEVNSPILGTDFSSGDEKPISPDYRNGSAIVYFWFDGKIFPLSISPKITHITVSQESNTVILTANTEQVYSCLLK